MRRSKCNQCELNSPLDAKEISSQEGIKGCAGRQAARCCKVDSSNGPFPFAGHTVRQFALLPQKCCTKTARKFNWAWNMCALFSCLQERRAEGRGNKERRGVTSKWKNGRQSNPYNEHLYRVCTELRVGNAVRSYLGIPGNKVPMIALDYSFLRSRIHVWKKESSNLY